jgi:hypothetical protein
VKALLKRIISDFHEHPFRDVYDRELTLPLDSNKIIVLTGPRRCGKSSFFYALIKKLTQKGVPVKNILYLNFEDERLELSTSDLDLILQSYYELYPNLSPSSLYFFFDEIQNIDKWEKFVRRCYDTITRHIFITGSNARLLSRDIASSLRGRTLSYELLPLSFKEYMQFNKIEFSKNDSRTAAMVRNNFEKYLVDGGYPELIFSSDDLKRKILQEYFDVMIYRDLVQKYNFSQLALVKYFLKRLSATTGSYLSLHKIYNDLRSQGYKLDKNLLYEIFEAAKDVYLSMPIDKFDFSEIKRARSEKKCYFIDNGLLNAVTFKYTQNTGLLLENLVYLHFRRMAYDCFYFKNGKECDFILYEKEPLPVQVCLSLNDPDTKEREINGLVYACNKLKVNKGVVITMDEEFNMKINGIKITVTKLLPLLLTKDLKMILNF